MARKRQAAEGEQAVPTHETAFVLYGEVLGYRGPFYSRRDAVRAMERDNLEEKGKTSGRWYWTRIGRDEFQAD
jgi:hypothetical protein